MTDDEFELLIEESLRRGLKAGKFRNRQSWWCDELGMYIGVFQLKNTMSARGSSTVCWSNRHKPKGKYWVPEVEGLSCPA